MDKLECISEVAKACGDEVDAKKFVEKAIEGREILKENPDYYSWYHNRFIPNLVMIDENDYSKSAIDALKTLSTLAATDFGSTRQRDFGQLWADQIRGYLAETAVQKHLRKFGLYSKLAHEVGNIDDFLDSDIPLVSEDGTNYRDTKKKIGVKGTKSNGIWLDIPGDQYNHSDYHILVKLGTDRGHLFGFFGQLGMVEKLVEEGKRVGVLDESNIATLIASLPVFRPISAYIVGFIKNTGPAIKLGDYGTKQWPGSSLFDGRLGHRHFTIHTWKGELDSEDYAKIAAITGAKERKGDARFVGIKDFSKARHTIFNTGSLEYSHEDWNRLISSL